MRLHQWAKEHLFFLPLQRNEAIYIVKGELTKLVRRAV